MKKQPIEYKISQLMKDVIADYVDEDFLAIDDNKLGNELIEKLEISQIDIALRGEEKTIEEYCKVKNNSRKEYVRVMDNLLNDTIDYYSAKLVEMSGVEGATEFFNKLEESNSDTIINFVTQKVLYKSFELDGNLKGKENGIQR